MRFDKLTTKFQQALSDAQSLAVGADNQFIEPQHLLLALLNDADSGAASLLARAGANVGGLKPALQEAAERSRRASTQETDFVFYAVVGLAFAVVAFYFYRICRRWLPEGFRLRFWRVERTAIDA